MLDCATHSCVVLYVPAARPVKWERGETVKRKKKKQQTVVLDAWKMLEAACVALGPQAAVAHVLGFTANVLCGRDAPAAEAMVKRLTAASSEACRAVLGNRDPATARFEPQDGILVWAATLRVCLAELEAAGAPAREVRPC